MAVSALQKITAAAKIYRRAHPKVKWTDAIKIVSRSYKANKKLSGSAVVKKAAKKKAAVKAAKHKDTKSHNVNIRVVSGLKKKRIGNVSANDFTRINNDTAGNPRYVIHWTAVANTYPAAVKIANKIGGKKFHTKTYGGGIVIQSYNIDATAKRLSEEISKSKIGSTLLLEKGESPKRKPKNILQVQRSKAGTFKKFKKISGLPAFQDQALADEILLGADNDSQLYYSQRLPIEKNLVRKWKKGTFDLTRSATVWRYYIDAADKRYSRLYTNKKGKGFLLSVYDRKLLATVKANDFYQGLKNNEFNDL